MTQIVAGACWAIYGSFFEWYWHKLWMHTPRTPKEAFHGHTIVHHGLYKSDESYFVADGEHPEHILLKPYALPAIVIAHIPLVLLIEHFVHHTAIGGIVSMTLYFVIYEYMHWNMHVPRGHFVERFRWFQFLRNHHRLHHKHFMKNFCVLLPLADLCLGTLITEQSLARRKAEREHAIANGQVAQERAGGKRRRQTGLVKLTRMASLRLARLTKLERFGARRTRETRRERRIREVRAMVQTVQPGGERETLRSRMRDRN
jgi:hypothetical protein